ncbi:MAG: hypothetical protein WC587_00425 [Candidatus Paceibacterota bacterium]
MNPVLKAHIEKKEFQHAYLLAGDYDASRKMAFEAAKVLLETEPTPGVGDFTDAGRRLETHPDFFYEKFNLFGVDESRKLLLWASQRPLLGSNKVFVAEVFSFSVESANALLKTFEEPFEGTHFFILVPSADAVIPTLRSRFVVIEESGGEKEITEETKKVCLDFLGSLPAKRVKIAEKFFKDKTEAVEFLNGLEMIIRSSASLKKPNFLALGVIQKAREFLFDRSPSVKMIMEYLALTLPKI